MRKFIYGFFMGFSFFVVKWFSIHGTSNTVGEPCTVYSYMVIPAAMLLFYILFEVFKVNKGGEEE